MQELYGLKQSDLDGMEYVLEQPRGGRLQGKVGSRCQGIKCSRGSAADTVLACCGLLAGAYGATFRGFPSMWLVNATA